MFNVQNSTFCLSSNVLFFVYPGPKNLKVEYFCIGTVSHLFVQILFQADPAAVWYQFATPSGSNQQFRKLPDFYLWKQAFNGSSMQWNPCSSTCGKGNIVEYHSVRTM